MRAILISIYCMVYGIVIQCLRLLRVVLSITFLHAFRLICLRLKTSVFIYFLLCFTTIDKALITKPETVIRQYHLSMNILYIC